MAKTVDIPDKLNFDENPRLKLGNEELEVNADAETVIRLMDVFAHRSDVQAVGAALELIFSPEDIPKIYSMKDKKGRKLSAASLMTIIQAAMELVMGDAGQGER